jgi:pyruvate formate lyase activating enzyme
VRCLLCPHECLVKEGHSGRCRVRTVSGGILQADGYGQISAAHLDPVEKKPLYHFHPGTFIYSIGGWGCNFRCRFCQNWTISQQTRFDPGNACRAGDVVRQAVASGGIGVAYTYNEPLTGYEFVYDCAEAVRKAGLKNVLVTNGYVEPLPAAALLPWIDAVNLDIKSMDDQFYREVCGGSLAPVLRFARQVVDAGVHLEVTNLLIPGLNSDDRQTDTLASWIAETLGPRIPLHITAYRPEYSMALPPTRAADLRMAFSRAKRLLAHVYTGNLDMPEGRDTLCQSCGAPLVEREGRHPKVTLTGEGRCASCRTVSEVVVQGMGS